MPFHSMAAVRTAGLRFGLALATTALLGATDAARAQEAPAKGVPEGRKVTHREQSLKEYDPFSADELFKRIKVPPAPALPPAEALKTFRVAEGFRIECVAAEPLVVDPVFFEFDPDGRIWAIEYRGWMRDIEGTGEGDPICRIVVLDDTDADGVMDASTVFLDELVMPRTLAFVAGGVLVAEPPHLWFCRDTDGDLVCDEKRRVGDYGKPGNPEHTDNGLMHAIDNWMYNAKSSVRHRFVDGEVVREPTLFRGQWGIAQDDHGRLFYNYQNSSLHADLAPADFIRRNPHQRDGGRAGTSAALNVNVATAAHDVFPIRVTPGITLGGNELREDGRLRTFTVACGPTIYRGDQFPEKYRGAAVIPEAGGHLIRLDLLAGDGATIAARNAFGETEWVASTDERFRPVCSRTGPDGAVYVCDLYRGIIEHVIFMMPYLRNQILSRGLDKPIGLGRIYRIVHEGRPLGPRPRLSEAANAELVEALSHPNGWWRDTAQRLLVERRAEDVVGPLRDVAVNGLATVGRVHALWTLSGIGRLDWATASAAAEADDPSVRASAIRLACRADDRPDPAAVCEWLRPLVSDRRPMVRLQTLLSLGDFARDASAGPEAIDAMASILAGHAEPLFAAAAISGLEDRELEMVERLLGSRDGGTSGAWTEAMERQAGAVEMLATCVVHAGDAPRLARLLDLAATNAGSRPWVTAAITGGVTTSKPATSRWPEPLALAGRPALLDVLEASDDKAGRRPAAGIRRIVTWPGDTTPREKKPVLVPLTPEQEKRRLQGESIYAVTCHSCHKGDGLGQVGQAPPLDGSEWVNGAPETLIRIALHGLRGPVTVAGQDWNMQMPGLGESPLMTDARMAGTLTYIRRGWNNHGSAIDPEQVAAVRRETSGRTSPWTVEELLDPSKAVQSVAGDPLEPYRPLLAGGDAEKGRILFHANREIRCNACHKVGAAGGGFVGPDLTAVGLRADREYLLESLIEPSRKIAKGYETIVVETDDGRVLSGTFVAERDGQLVLAPPAGGEVSVGLDSVVERVVSGVSSMPPMGQTFTPPQVADLVAYLLTLKGSGEQR
jgi:putative heme-binding domain-containing protein